MDHILREKAMQAQVCYEDLLERTGIQPDVKVIVILPSPVSL